MISARGLWAKDLERRLDTARELGALSYEVARRQRIVLGLGHEIGSDHGCLGARVGEHADLGGARDHVDAHIARDKGVSAAAT